MIDNERKQNPFEGITFAEATELKTWLGQTGIEVFPSELNLEKIRLNKPKIPIEVTSSPSNGMKLTKDFCFDLASEGEEAIPHLAARNIVDAELEGLLTAFFNAGMKKFVVMGGDNQEPRGKLKSTMDLLQVIVELGYKPELVYVAGYPRGHSFLSPKERDIALFEKQDFSEKHGVPMKIKTQICADPRYIASFLNHLEKIKITLPVVVGLLGPVKLKSANEHLLEVGVTDLALVLKRIKSINPFEDLALLRFKPEDFLRGLATRTGNRVYGVYFYTLGAYNRTLESISTMKSYLSAVT